MRRVVLLRSNPVNPDPAVERIVSVLADIGWKVTIIGWDRNEEYDFKEEELKIGSQMVRIIRFGIPAIFSGGLKKNLVSLLKFEKRLADWLCKNKSEYDAIHAFDFDTGFLAKHISKKYKKKLVYHILDFYAADRFRENSIGYKIVRNMEFSVINIADATIICSEARKKQISGSKPVKLEIIHNTPGYTQPSENFELKSNTDKVKIVYVGCFEDNRFIEELINCVMADERTELHIGGFGKNEEYVRECSQKCNRILFYGRLLYEDVLCLEKQCDILTAMYNPVIANNRYAAPNKLYEAMMLSKPVMMCKNTGWDELILQNDTGILIEPTEKGIGIGIDMFITRKDEWCEMGKRAFSVYKKDYSWSVMRNRIRDLYRDL